jgi:iron complex transport system ATP-binding protein
MNTIKLSDITVSLHETLVLDSITTSFPSGVFAGLIGPNGAGKTTLLRTINGRLPPTSGTVTIGGDKVSALSSRQLGKRIATVQQTTTLSFDFTVRKIVEMGRHPHQSRFSYRKPPTEIIDWALERTDITHLEHRPITDISGGEL